MRGQIILYSPSTCLEHLHRSPPKAHWGVGHQKLPRQNLNSWLGPNFVRHPNFGGPLKGPETGRTSAPRGGSRLPVTCGRQSGRSSRIMASPVSKTAAVSRHAAVACQRVTGVDVSASADSPAQRVLLIVPCICSEGHQIPSSLSLPLLADGTPCRWHTTTRPEAPTSATRCIMDYASPRNGVSAPLIVSSRCYPAAGISASASWSGGIE